MERIVKATAFGDFAAIGRAEGLRGRGLMRAAIGLAPLFVGLALGACAEKPEVDQIAQTAMIGLSGRDIQACLGAPASRRAVAQATEIWTYPVGYTTSDAPPWAAGIDFAAVARPACDVRLVMTGGHVSQVTYALPDGRALPLGRRCAFTARLCAMRRERL